MSNPQKIMDEFNLPDATESEMSQIVDALSEEDRAHFKLAVWMLAHAYGDNPKLQGVLVMSVPESTSCTVSSFNCDEMEAAKLLQAANEFLYMVNTADAPPKEMLN
jgi:hypothetical protein